MSRIYEEIEIEGKKVKVKIDTGSDFPLSLRKELINELGLPMHPTIKAQVFREEEGKPKTELEPTWTAETNIRGCKLILPIVEAKGDNLLGNTLLQKMKASIDAGKDGISFTECPKSPWFIDKEKRIFELTGNFVLTGYCGEGKLGEFVGSL
jgi:predicted aspartyl protease